MPARSMGGIYEYIDGNVFNRTRGFASVPAPKFVSISGAPVRTSEPIRTLANLIVLVPLLNPKFASERPQTRANFGFASLGENTMIGRDAAGSVSKQSRDFRHVR
jgi:hypothetical protein